MFSKFSLRFKMTFVVFLSCAICALVALGVSMRETKKQLHEGIISKSETILSRLESARGYVATQGGLKTTIAGVLRSSKSVDAVTEDQKMEVLKQVPIFAAMQIGSENADKENYTFRIISDQPRRKDNLANSEELEILKDFENNPGKTQIVKQTATTISVYRPVRLSEAQGCLNCHGNPTTSPWGNGKDILGYKMENWADGKLHGAFGIISNIEAVAKAEAGSETLSPTETLVLWIMSGALFALMFGFLFATSISRTFGRVSGNLDESASAVSEVAIKMASASQALSSSTNQQAAALQETTSAIEETSAMIAKNAENAKQSMQVSEQSQGTVTRGKQAVDDMVHSIDEISHSNVEIMKQIEESNREISNIVKVIAEIGNKTKVINDIVFQTKLLSFNASVEAARAGEHGKGFAVVAEEVGNLAQMSGNSAKEITTLLESSIKQVEEIVNNTKTRVERLTQAAKQKIDAGTLTAKRCGEILDEIVSNVSEVGSMVSEISTASQEQAKGVTEINKAMTELDSVAQQNSASSSQSAASAEELRSQVETLRTMVDQLNLIIGGGSGRQQMAKVIPLRKKPKAVVKPTTALKMAAGADFTPDHDDPGFEDT